MTKELLHEWLDESPERSRVFIEEGLILDATEAICEALEKQGMSRANLAGSAWEKQSVRYAIAQR